MLIFRFGVDNIEVYTSGFKPTDWNFKPDSYTPRGFCKAIVNKGDQDRVVGLHYVGPGAAEIMQGFAVAMKLKATIWDLKDTIAIHPSCSEELVLMNKR